jgi:hypothetical protein
MITFTAEQAAAELGGISRHAVGRMMRDGVAVGKRRVRLGRIKLGRRYCTTPELIKAFVDEQRAAADSRPTPRVHRDRPRANTHNNKAAAAVAELIEVP